MPATMTMAIISLMATMHLTFLVTYLLPWFQANEEKEEMRALQEYNMKLVGNILPMHVAEHFLKTQMRKDEVGNYVF